MRRPSPAPVPGRIALVGPCAVGKSALVEDLRELGLDVKQPAQEHSGVPDMWRRLSRPEILVYLDASYDTLKRHRPHIDWDERYLAKLQDRLAHARANADLVLNVDGQNHAETLAAIEKYLAVRAADA